MGVRQRKAHKHANTHAVAFGIAGFFGFLSLLMATLLVSLTVTVNSWLDGLPDYTSADAYLVPEPTTLYAADIDAYDDFFPSLGVERVQELRTAWDGFDAFDPGDCFTIRVDGVTIYDLPELMKDKGLYFAERREED